MYRDLLPDQLCVNFLGPAPLDLELLHMLTTFHWNALGSTLGWWFCHNNTVSCNEKIWVEQVTVPHPPPWGRTRGGDCVSTLLPAKPKLPVLLSLLAKVSGQSMYSSTHGTRTRGGFDIQVMQIQLCQGWGAQGPPTSIFFSQLFA